ncbi:MAG: hypothetical protein HYV08_16340 [Deltaproteobacteria bacterium]|nr:hypothetical protein [Deltaproteobacteria bacterium]MBI3077205.1 hypothetical protein [Deltaproteobacteria bacterium]
MPAVIPNPVSVRFGREDVELARALKARARAEKRSLSEQIKYYAHLGMVAKDNPDLPMSFIEGVLEGLEEARGGLAVPYPWGVLR